MPIVNQSATLPSKVYYSEQIKKYERISAEKLNISLYQLMERAGHAIFDSIVAHFPRVKSCLMLAGAGNNGGDAFVVARLAQQSGIRVLMYAKDQGRNLSGDALIAKQAFLSAGGDIFELSSLPSHLNSIRTDIVIDGLLGTGFTGELRPLEKEVIDAVNQLAGGKIAIDVPTGLNADTGDADSSTFVADTTITFVALKAGLFTAKGPDHIGKLIYCDLEIGETFHQIASSSMHLVHKSTLPHISKRTLDSHKGRFGTALIIGGAPSMAGAVYLAAKSALRSGVGKVRVLCHPCNVATITGLCPEVMVVALVSSSMSETINLEMSKASMVIFGPGLGNVDWSRQVFTHFLSQPNIESTSIVFDADGLNLLAEASKASKSIKANDTKPWVFTPHPLEAARLLNKDVAVIQKDRLRYAQSIAKEYGVLCVLKGAGTITANKQVSYINTTGNPGMATAGMGDVLTGVICGAYCNEFIGSKYLIENVVFAVFLHGMAGDFTAKDGEIGMIASDVIQSLPTTIRMCQ